MGFSVRIAPGVRVRASSRGIRTSIGTRAARVHVGGGRAGFSTGAGPFTYYTRVGGGRGKRRSPSRARSTSALRTPAASTTRTTMTLAQANKQQEASRLREAFEAIMTIHHETFAPAHKPLTPPPALVDAGVIRRECVSAGLKGVGLFDRAGRKAAKARGLAEAEIRVQQEVDSRRQQAIEHQAELNEMWTKLLANDPDVVLDRLATAFEDNEASAAPLGVSDAEATIVVLLPGEDVVPARRPTTTAAGNLSLKKMAKKDRDAFYTVLAAGYTLVTVKEAFAVAPSLESVRVVAVRRVKKNAYGAKLAEVMLAAHIRLGALAGVRWTSEDAPTILSDVADELLMLQKGVAKTLTALDLSKEPELEKVVDSIDFDELER